MDGASVGRAPRGGVRKPRKNWEWSPNSLLGGLNDTARDRLLALGAMAQYPPDRILIREAEESAFVLVLLDGVVKATARAQNEREALLAMRMGGDLVGEF